LEALGKGRDFVPFAHVFLEVDRWDSVQSLVLDEGAGPRHEQE
jgi:hypothetical protein